MKNRPIAGRVMIRSDLLLRFETNKPQLFH